MSVEVEDIFGEFFVLISVRTLSAVAVLLMRIYRSTGLSLVVLCLNLVVALKAVLK